MLALSLDLLTVFIRFLPYNFFVSNSTFFENVLNSRLCYFLFRKLQLSECGSLSKGKVRTSFITKFIKNRIFNFYRNFANWNLLNTGNYFFYLKAFNLHKGFVNFKSAELQNFSLFIC